MAPSGLKPGKLVLPACQHSSLAKPFLTAHLCWQDRVAKERSADFSASPVVRPAKDIAPKPIQKTQSLSALELARHEYHPIGGSGIKNNNSSEMSKSIGAGSWKASGGIKSDYGAMVGKPAHPYFGEAPHLKNSFEFLDRAIRNEGKLLARLEQVEAIQQHSEDTIIGLKRGDQGYKPHNVVEAQVLVKGYSPQQQQPFGLYKPGTGNSALTGTSRSDSWGSVHSDARSELRRIHELGERARAVGMKGAAVHQAEAMRNYSEDTILGIEKGVIAPHNPVEDALLAHHRAPPGLPAKPVARRRQVSSRAVSRASRDSHVVSRCSSNSTTTWGSASNPADELKRIHELAGEARELARKGAGAHQLSAMRQLAEDDVLHDLHHPDQY